MKTHLNFSTSDLAKSVSFYGTLLNDKPAKHYEDYALFITENPGLELALDVDASPQAGDSAHYGVVVESAEDVEAAISRLQAAKLNVDIQREQTCCYATQTKVWVADPDGRRWEIYTVLEDTQERDGSETTCCKSEESNESCCAV
jgi:catechol 2,3-dioxygenase-like lactoylglutathione lyase family enzyme